jgi:hypothetical protein
MNPMKYGSKIVIYPENFDALAYRLVRKISS